MATSPATRPVVELSELPAIEEGARAPAAEPTTFLLEGISWETYESLLRDFEADGSHVRMTYDSGSLEFMSPGVPHERAKKYLARIVEVVVEELNIPIYSGGGATFRRRVLKQGLEPDECFWIAREPLLRGVEEPDFEIHPMPDLAIESEWSRNVLMRLPIYGALGFVEVWRVTRSGRLVVHGFGPDREPVERAESAVFPFLPLAEVARFLDESRKIGEVRWLRRFRAWVRETLAPQHARPDDDPPA